MKKHGFTLAEVLITLSIIGIVAALTIPTLVANYQKQQYVVGLKKATAVWTQALAQMANDSGCPGDLSCFFDSDAPNIMGAKIASYFKPIKTCKTSQYLDCVAMKKEYVSGQGSWTSTGGHYSFITADGMTVSLDERFNLNCKIESYRVWNNRGMAYMCSGSYNYIDVNGQKGPNVVGRDIFYFWIINQDGLMFVPYNLGNRDISYLRKTCDPNDANPSFHDGMYCTALIMQDGWQMNY